MNLTSKIHGLAAFRALLGFYTNPISTAERILEDHGNAVSFTRPFARKNAEPVAFFFSGADNNRDVYSNWDDLRMIALWSVHAKPETAQHKTRLNYLCLSGEAHRVIANQIESPLKRNQIKNLISDMHTIMKPIIDDAFNKDTFDLVKFNRDLSIQCVFGQLFGEPDAARALHIGHLVDRLNLANYRKINKILKYDIPGLPYHDLLKQAEVVQNTLADWIKEVDGQPSSTNLRSSVWSMTNSDGSPLSLDFKIACIAVLIFAAFDTPALGLLWTFVLLSRNPEVALKLRDEIKAANFSGKISYEALNKLPYLNSVLLESLRLLPPAPLIPIKSVRKTKIGSVDIPRNASIILSPRETQRDPDVYPDPETFRPERWKNIAAPNAYEFIAFSGGIRRCPGASFSTTYMKLVIAELVERGGLELLTRGPIPTYSRPTMAPLSPVMVRRSESGHFC